MILKWAPKGGFGVPLEDNPDVYLVGLISDDSDYFVVCVDTLSGYYYINHVINKNRFSPLALTTANLERVGSDEQFEALQAYLEEIGFAEYIDGLKRDFIK